MNNHFNGLTPAEAERLAILAEECAEVIQMVSKIQRHGYFSWHPDDTEKTTNRTLLAQELSEVIAIASAMGAAFDIYFPIIDDIEKAWQKKMKYTHHQEEFL